jgi:flagellar biosynthesis/type III secretory pathway M-ring protein FliF/YscJ
MTLPVTRLRLPVAPAIVNPGRSLARVVEYALAALVLALVVASVVLAPLRRGPAVDAREDERRATLEAAKEAKYREIRDAELDFRMGKLTDAEYKTTDRELRAQAIAILRELDEYAAEDAAAAGRG